MKKIGIITLNGYFNYGNRLQNYALQKVLESKGYQSETILLKENKRTTVQNKLISLIKKTLKKCKKNLIKLIKFRKTNLIKKRTQRFKVFTNKYMKESSYYNSIKEIPTNEFDYFISGSDQVWNPSYNKHSSFYFLDFAPKIKRISYAASFGITELPDEVIPNYKRWLSNIPHLSVREESGSKIVKNLTEREVNVVLDPTLLITKDHWLSISKRSKNKPKHKYLLTYFLGQVSNNKLEKVKQISKENSLEIVQLGNIKDKDRYIVDPSEFIDYFNSADVILTDSFHGCVFSILLEKPFIVFEREGGKKSMISRIDTLLETFQLEDRKLESIKDIKDVYNIEYHHVSPILEKEREKSHDFLNKALNYN